MTREQDVPPSSDKVHRSPGNRDKQWVPGLPIRILVGLFLHRRAVAVRYSLLACDNVPG
jgi:hypothetical protein